MAKKDFTLICMLKEARNVSTAEAHVETQEDFEPKIIGLFCNWCTYTGADLAGTSRIQYPPNIRIIRVMCTGSVDPLYILKPILEGADGVLVGG